VTALIRALETRRQPELELRTVQSVNGFRRKLTHEMIATPIIQPGLQHQHFRTRDD